MTSQPQDRVERETFVRAPAERVYAALTDPALFPTWGPERVEGRLAVGERPILDFGPGGRCAVYVVALEPPRYFAYRWAQGETDPELLLRDPLAGPNTLVEFHVEAVDGGTRVRVVESGIASLPGMPGVDRDKAIEHMGEGWQLMLGGLPRYFASADLVPGDRVDAAVVVAAPRAAVHDALVHPERWWAQSVDGAVAAGETPLLDFGPFGKIRIHVVAVEAPDRLAYRWVQGVADPARRADDPRTTQSTLVELRLDDQGGGTRVEVLESGFEALPGELGPHVRSARQAWGVILGLLERHFVPR